MIIGKDNKEIVTIQNAYAFTKRPMFPKMPFTFQD